MKKHLITTASVFALTFAGQAFANESDINQLGLGNDAMVTQIDGTEGVSDIDQIGDNHTANVTQADVPNVGNGVFSTASNTSTILQTGNGASATVNQTGNPGETPGNVSEISQNVDADSEGTASATVTQTGANNTSTVSQGRPVTPPATGGQTAFVFQGGEDHISTIDQRGDLNFAEVEQLSVGNTSNVDQFGLDNFADVFQTGAGNTSNVLQSANFGTTRVFQTGDNNVSDVEQSGRANFSVAALIDQSGNGNTSEILQTSLVDAAGSADQFAEVTQSTDGNTSRISQDGGDPVADASNPGNTASVFQTATAGNLSVITQSGAGNSATVNQ